MEKLKFKKRKMPVKDVLSLLDDLPDEVIDHIAFSNSWQYGRPEEFDSDGFSESVEDKKEPCRDKLQLACWDKFHKNPHVNTSIRGIVGRMVGSGFSTSSAEFDINTLIREITYDVRNRLYTFIEKYVTRNKIEGELFILLTLHEDGFVEIDFIDPSVIQGGDGDGVISHKNKGSMPLVYNIDNGGDLAQYPSIFVGHFPSLLKDIDTSDALYDSKLLKKSAGSNNPKFKSLGGFNKFVVSWDRGLMTKRSVSHLRTTLEWLNLYELLKKYEIDHKRSSGSYLWLAQFDDIKSYKLWLSMTDEQRASTGLMAKKVPGGTLMLPPGIKFSVQNPTLPKISEEDTDILHMITSGLNEPEDVTTGQSKGTFSSTKASRGPMSDRISDEVEYFRRFYIYDFWASIFFLHSSVTDFPKEFSVKEVVGWKPKKNQEDEEEEMEPIIKVVKYRPEFLIDVDFPTSNDVDYEGNAKAFLGTKHGSTNTTMGFSNTRIARQLGVNSYRRERLDQATEELNMPSLIDTEDDESVQERNEAEPARGKVAKPVKPIRRKI